ncbi:WD repeat and FYVE domain-containing protein 2 [Galemys pyrenaicus]|uniref:WD repeat and FYVE domain-containing protein 2 n=1 Tax=Galemys pyrenaicus TaxID=202257 RepID=A0A8J6ANP4_GALPY|nr:WD repeat and FYVE domain-containing protein 2 [Galemys pyrenaicus]
MAAEIQPKPLTRKPILLQRVEGSQEVVNMAVIVPKEEGVISVSEDSVNVLLQVFIVMRILVLLAFICAPLRLRGLGIPSRDSGVRSGLARGRMAPVGARVILGLTMRRPLDLGPIRSTGGEREELPDPLGVCVCVCMYVCVLTVLWPVDLRNCRTL